MAVQGGGISWMRVLSNSQLQSSLVLYSYRYSCQQEPVPFPPNCSLQVLRSSPSGVPLLCLGSAQPTADPCPTLLASLLPA